MTIDPFTIPAKLPPIADSGTYFPASDPDWMVPVRAVGSTFETQYLLGGTVFDERTGVLSGFVFNPKIDEFVTTAEHDVEHVELVTTHQVVDWEMIPGEPDGFAHGMFLYGDDVEPARNVEQSVFDELSSMYTDGFVPPVGSAHKEADDRRSVNPSECEHFQQGVKVDIGGIEMPVILCQRCEEFHGIQYHDDWQARDTTYNANWFLESLSSDRADITNIGDAEYVLHMEATETMYEGIDALTRPDITGLMLTRNTSLTTENQIGMYVPHAHNLHILSVDDEAVAVLLATDGGHDPQILVLGVRDEFRGEGHATQLVEAWIDHAGVDSRYELYDPNEAGLSVFEALGHYNPKPSTQRGKMDAVVTLELQRMDLSVDQFATLNSM